MQFKEVALLLAVVAWRAEAKAVADVKGAESQLPDEAAADPYFDHNPQYGFAYSIQDEETGDAKGQSEERRGDAVQGSYSIVQPDGTLRVVRYTADDINGFNAVVSLTPGHSKPIVPQVKKSVLPVAQQRVSVVQHHVDVPVPVQHHVLSSPATEQIFDKKGVLVEHPVYQAGVVNQQHLIQPPLTLGAHQDVHHLVPHQFHHYQVPSAEIQHHTAISQQQSQGSLKQDESANQEQNLEREQGINAANAAVTSNQEQGKLNDYQTQQQQQQQLAEGTIQQTSSFLQDQENNNIQQQQVQEAESPQVVEVRHSIQQGETYEQQTQQIQQQQQPKKEFQFQQFRSFDTPQLIPHQRTLAVYRTSPTASGAHHANYITFSSPYAHYTIS